MSEKLGSEPWVALEQSLLTWRQTEAEANKRLREQLAQAKTFFESLHSESDVSLDAEHPVQKVRVALNDARGYIKQQRMDLEEATQRADEQTRLLEETRGQLEELTEAAASGQQAQETIQELEGRLAEAQDALEAAQSERDQIKRQCEQERQRAHTLQGQVDAERAKHAKSALAEELAEALREAETAQQQVSKLEDELSRLRTEEPAPADDPSQSSLRVGRPVARQLGDILLDAGVISFEQLRQAENQVRTQPDLTLAQALVAADLIDEDCLAQAVACQRQVLLVDIDQEDIPPDAVALINGRLAHKHTCLPLRKTDDGVVLAMVDPLDLIAIEDVERTANCRVYPVVAPPSQINAAINALYPED